MHATITHSWILTIHKARILRKKRLEKTFLDFKKWVKTIQTGGCNGACTVLYMQLFTYASKWGNTIKPDCCSQVLSLCSVHQRRANHSRAPRRSSSATYKWCIFRTNFPNDFCILIKLWKEKFSRNLILLPCCFLCQLRNIVLYL